MNQPYDQQAQQLEAQQLATEQQDRQFGYHMQHGHPGHYYHHHYHHHYHHYYHPHQMYYHQ